MMEILRHGPDVEVLGAEELREHVAAALSEVTERPTGRSNTGTLVEVDKGKKTKEFVQIITLDEVTR
mgnify:CR=1 FL=1